MYADVEPRPVLLIDADNLREDAWLEAAKEQLKSYSGKLPVIRAYGAVELLQRRSDLWAKLGAELVPNLALEKNTTDASLIADAVELCLKEGFRFFGIASGDADFAPLAIRLRRWGGQVWCFAVTQNLFKDAHKYYDKVVQFDAQPCIKAKAPAVLEKPCFVRPLAVQTHPIGVVNALAASLPASGEKLKGNAISAVAKPVQAKSVQENFRQAVLGMFPALLQGQELLLAEVVYGLRKKEVIGKTEKLSSWNKKFGKGLQFIVEQGSHRVRYSCNTRAAQSMKVKEPVKNLQGLQSGRSNLNPLSPKGHTLRTVLWELIYRKVCVADVLLTVPELLDKNQCFALSNVAGRLRAKKFLASNHSARKIFELHREHFRLDLQANPPCVQYLG